MAGLKHDEGKLDWHALPLELVELLVPVAVNGANKYGRHSILQTIEDAGPRHYSATMRHLSACQLDPLAIDPESGCYHAVHAAYDLLARVYQCELLTAEPAEPSGYSVPPIDDGDDGPAVHFVPDRTSRNWSSQPRVVPHDDGPPEGLESTPDVVVGGRVAASEQNKETIRAMTPMAFFNYALARKEAEAPEDWQPYGND